MTEALLLSLLAGLAMVVGGLVAGASGAFLAGAGFFLLADWTVARRGGPAVGVSHWSPESPGGIQRVSGDDS